MRAAARNQDLIDGGQVAETEREHTGDEQADFAALVAMIRLCRICRESPLRPLPHEPRPVLRVGSGRPRLWICGQAPGTRVHASGMPFTDPSGERLRDWLGLEPGSFYDEDRVAIVPMGLCFPGQDGKGADLPPRPECARTWHDRLFAAMGPPDLIVALGTPALRYHLRRAGRSDLLRPTLGETVMDWRRILDETGILPLPHPSWRNSGWLKRNPWFTSELVPVLRARVRSIMAPA
jgi:uracil-DNA glycosylase